jgi:hypothetical protein
MLGREAVVDGQDRHADTGDQAGRDLTMRGECSRDVAAAVDVHDRGARVTADAGWPRPLAGDPVGDDGLTPEGTQ